MIHDRGFLKIKAECKTINAPLPIIDAENGGASVSASGCEQYMPILRYGQYGQVGADGVRRNKEGDTIKTDDKKSAKSDKQQKIILKFMEIDKEYRLQDFCDLLGLKETLYDTSYPPESITLSGGSFQDNHFPAYL